MRNHLLLRGRAGGGGWWGLVAVVGYTRHKPCDESVCSLKHPLSLDRGC